MGTNFFKSGGFGLENAGKVGKTFAPVSKYLKFVSPGAGMSEQMANRARRDSYVASTPTPFAGVTPTLADANNGYQTRAPMPAAPGAAPSLYQPPVPPKIGVQPMTPNPWGRF